MEQLSEKESAQFFAHLEQLEQFLENNYCDETIIKLLSVALNSQLCRIGDEAITVQAASFLSSSFDNIFQQLSILRKTVLGETRTLN
jgi:hypothetical protein